MAGKLSTSFISHGWSSLSCQEPCSPSFRFLLLPCRMRHKNIRLSTCCAQQRKQVRRISPQKIPSGAKLRQNSDDASDMDSSPTTEISSLSYDQISNKASGDTNEEDVKSQPKFNEVAEIISLDNERMLNESVDSALAVGNTNDVIKSIALQNDVKSRLLDADAGGKVSSFQLQNFIGIIKNAEKNILILNQARAEALKDLEKILNEKKSVQEEINALQLRLVETDARIRVVAQEKLHVELLEDQLEKLQNELSIRGCSEGSSSNVVEAVALSNNSTPDSLVKELSILRQENMSLKNDLEVFKAELDSLKGTDERVALLEKERFLLESSIKELETKLLGSKEDISKLSTLRVDYKSICEKVEYLQELSARATKEADKAISMLQKNHELQEKVDKLEQYFEEANVYKLSSEKLQQHNEIMQQKIKALEERLEKSDEEISSFLELYQESVKEFQSTLNLFKDERKEKTLDGLVDDMPWEFWSRLFLVIDGWVLEKKISLEDAMLLREMALKRDRKICDAYLMCNKKNEHDTIDALLKLTSSHTRAGLHIIHIAAEMAPVAKVGGLGDVVTGLSKALQKKGHLVEIILPKYDCMQYERIHDLKVLDMVLESYFDGQLFKNSVWVGTVEGLPVYFIEPQHPGKFFWRGKYYGENDDFKRFSFFSRAALELILQAGKKPDIIHCHDWQTAFVAPLYWDVYVPKGLNSARICFTCHNFEYQGTAPASEMASCGLDVHQLNRPDRMQDDSSHDRVNPVKGAIVFSNIVTTVSPTYAQEVRTPEEGRGLHTTIKYHSKKFVGILNGIDTDVWNPATDIYLKVHYSVNDIQGKAENKEALRRILGLSSADIRQPLVGCITRLVPQKGVHLIRHAVYRTLDLGGQFVLLGSSPVHHIQKEFEDIAHHFQNHENVRLILKYDEALSHLIYAASDMFIIPSLFEPCGLTQMIAMQYGAIPIARKTGGLNDSVFDVDDETIPVQFRNGFTFLTPDEQGFNSAFDRAFNLFKNKPSSWQQLVEKDMRIDFSWDSSASQYEEIYGQAVARARSVNRALTNPMHNFL
ncbi:probable starch synthase 4, chloroplastic/amyloplastic [Impatiens glandulifera]|uniref:probable starch synthase 4, chloroplastic/amyloplastic n=1 Tax=Impatiens glandulifera TaxID=253017 RepID=UPI001FB140BC|nr:probable starch synthase 4, chloroplastic/amyloplastic [Impatiens glandulifera]